MIIFRYFLILLLSASFNVPVAIPSSLSRNVLFLMPY
nr:MAG TPA: hypothetical protein [Caudoviricetes sp.]